MADSDRPGPDGQVFRLRLPSARVLWWAVAVGAVYLVAVVIWVIVFGPDSPDSGATQIDPQQGQIDELIMDRDNLPDVYTGELADIDADGTPDLALFGDPDAPVLRPLTEPRPRDWAPFLAAIPAVAIVLAALVTQVGAWARNKRAEPEPHTDDST